MLQLLRLCSTASTPQGRGKIVPWRKKTISTIPYMPLLSEVQKLLFLQSKSQRTSVTTSTLQSDLLQSSSGSGFLCPCFLSPLILHSPYVFRTFSVLSRVLMIPWWGWNSQWYKPLISDGPKRHFCDPWFHLNREDHEPIEFHSKIFIQPRLNCSWMLEGWIQHILLLSLFMDFFYRLTVFHIYTAWKKS